MTTTQYLTGFIAISQDYLDILHKSAIFTLWIKPFSDNQQLTFDPEASLQIGTGNTWHLTFENFKVEDYAQHIEAELIKLLKEMPFTKGQTKPKLEFNLLIHYNDPDNNCFQAKSYYNTPLNIIISKDLTTSLTTEISIIEPPTPDSNTKTSDIDCNRCENPFVVNKDIVLRVRQGTFTSENDFQNGEIEGDYHEHCLNVS